MAHPNKSPSAELQKALTAWASATADIHTAIEATIKGKLADQDHLALLRARVETTRLMCEKLARECDPIRKADEP